MKENVYFYVYQNGKNPIREFIDKLEKKQQTKVHRLFNLINEYGLSAVGNHLKRLTGTPFWEVRILGKDNTRFLYVTIISNQILILNGFIKKTEKTPHNEIILAQKRYEEWQIRKKSLDK